MEYPGLQNNNKSIEKGPDLIIADSVSKLPYNSKSGSIVEVVNKGVKKLTLDAIFPHYFYIHINDTSVGDIARTDDGKTLSILENLEAVYYNSNNLKKIIHYLRVAILGLIYREYEVLENLRWKNLNNIKIFTFKSSKEPYLYNGEEWEKMDYVQKSDFAFDNAPTQDSSSLLTSGVIYNELSNKADLINGKVPSDLLPSYVDDVLEFPEFQNFPEIGESGKIYIDVSTNSCYRWSGSTYIEIQSPIELDEYPILGSTNAIESGGVYSALLEKLDIISDLSEIRLGAAAGATALLSFTETDPTVPSHVKSITQQNITDWNNKQSALTFDNTPTTNSINPVTSDGIKTALDVKADKTELPLIVHMDDTLLTCGTSIADIYTAYSVGRVVQMKIAGLSVPLSLVSSSSSSTAFAVTDKGTSLIVSGTNESGSDVWTIDSFVAQEKLTFDSTPTTGSQNPVTSNGIKTAIDGKQDTLVSGTNIKTINNTSLLGSGNINIEPNLITSITTTESSASGGNNTVTINTTNGTSKTFNVKNGKDGADGVSLGEIALVQTTGDSEDSVMSQKAVTDAIQYNISTEHGEGFTVNSNGTYRYIKLTPKAVSLLNASDKMTFMFSTRATGGNQDYRYFRFGNGSTTTNQVDGTNGVYVDWSYSRNLSANGVDYTLNKTGSNYVTPDIWIVTWDRINGVVKFYDHTTLVNTLTSDSYKKDKFVNDGGLLAFRGGDNNARIYDIRLFDYDISFLFGYADVSTEINCLCGAGVLPALFLDNYQMANNDGSFKSSVKDFSGGGSTTCTYTWDGDDYHIVVKDGTTTSQVCGGKPYYLGRNNSAQIEKLEFQVVSGVIKHCWRTNQLNENLNYRLILDSNGEEIADYDNIGVGNYTLIKTQGAVGSRFDFYKVSGNVEVVINRNMQYRPISCVFHLRGDTMYNKKFYDDQTESFITLYSDRTCATEYTTHTMVKTPQRIIRNNISTSDGLPHYPGEMAVVGNKVYVGLADYTWKQINNS